MSERARPSGGEGESIERALAAGTERLVQRDAFGELLARATENVVGVTKLGFDMLDLVVRNLRLAGRPDIQRLGRQIARAEDKLEMVLQELEALRAELVTAPAPRADPAANGHGGTPRAPAGSEPAAP
jgi:hypothetical protein